MPFKIVQTTENGATYLEIVPNGWEHDDKCYWPMSGLKAKQKIEHSLPDDTFFSTACKVKRRNIESYKMASEILSVMELQSDTDNTDIEYSLSKNPCKKKSETSIKALSVIPAMKTDVSFKAMRANL